MFNITLYKIKKRNNSTKQPAADTVKKEMQCDLLGDCSLDRPNIVINFGEVNPAEWNYAYIPDFGRYYWITDRAYSRQFWTLSLASDPYASFKTDILASTEYVLRSASQSDGRIVDNAYPTLGANWKLFAEHESPWNLEAQADGQLVMGIIGNGGVSYYAFTYSAARQLFQEVFSDEFASALTQNWSSVFPSLKAQCNPMQYFTSVMWSPLDLGVTPDSTSSLQIGWVFKEFSGCKLLSRVQVITGSEEWTLERHPDATARGSYLNFAPYASYKLFFPPWGYINLPADVCATSTKIITSWEVDATTGEGRLTVKTDNGILISVLASQIYTPFQVSQVLTKDFGFGEIMGTVGGMGISAGGQLALADKPNQNYAGSAASAFGAITGVISSIGASSVPSANVMGSNGSVVSLRGKPTMFYHFQRLVDSDNEHLGRPLCKRVQLSTLSGFVMCASPDAKISGTIAEQNTVNAALASGLFLE